MSHSSLSATGFQSDKKESAMLLFLPTLLLFVLVTVMVKSLLFALLLLLLLEISIHVKFLVVFHVINLIPKLNKTWLKIA